MLLRQKASVPLSTMIFNELGLLESDPDAPPLPITSVPPVIVVPPVYVFESVSVSIPLPVSTIP